MMAEATVSQSITVPAVNKFALTYDKQTDVCLVRYGSSAKEPTIHELRWKTSEEYFDDRQKQYEQGRKHSQGAPFQKKDRKPVDFVVDENGLILAKGTSGNFEFSRNLSFGAAIFRIRLTSILIFNNGGTLHVV